MVTQDKGLKASEQNYVLWKNFLDNTPDSYKQWFDNERKYLDKHIVNGSRVLDIGCGNGRSLGYLTHKNVELYGIDHNPFAVLEGKRNFVNNDNVNIIRGDARDIYFRESLFDNVLAVSVPANFGKYKNLIYSEMKKVLKPKGEIILSVYNEDAFEERIKSYRAFGISIKSINGTTVIMNSEGEEYISEQFSKPELEEMFEENGLKPIEIVKQGIGYFCRLRK